MIRKVVLAVRKIGWGFREGVVLVLIVEEGSGSFVLRGNNRG